MTASPTPQQLIETYVKYRDFKKAAVDEFAAKMKPYTDAMDMIEAQLLVFMKAGNLTSVKSESGTAYQSMQTRFSIENREQFLDYLFGLVHADDPMAENYISNVVPKESITAFMEGNGGMLPPGILVNRELTVNIRRA